MKLIPEVNTEKTGTRGTDEVFYKIVQIAPAAILKLVGITQGQQYQISSETLKSKKISPDVIAKPTGGSGDVVFMEFQGYKDKYIRYRLTSSMVLYCSQNEYAGGLLPVIFYIDRSYHDVALPLERSDSTGNFGFKGNFKEIILEDLSEEELLHVDPQLVVLAPLITPKGVSKEELIRKSQNWMNQVRTVYPDQDTSQVLDNMALLLLNRFKKLTREEVVQMLNFDLADTQAGQDLIKMGKDEGKIEGKIEEARELLLEALEVRFKLVSDALAEQINRIDSRRILKYLHRLAIQADNLESFRSEMEAALQQE